MINPKFAYCKYTKHCVGRQYSWVDGTVVDWSLLRRTNYVSSTWRWVPAVLYFYYAL